MRLANAEDRKPEDADANCGETDDRGTEEKQNYKEEDDVVNGEDLGRLHEHPVDGLEYVDVCEKIAAVSLADAILCFVDTSDEHAGEDKKNDDDQQDAANEFYGA